MQRLTNILETHFNKQRVLAIDSKEAFSTYVHEQFSKSSTYNETRVNMIVENLSSTYGSNWERAIKELENFQMHR